MVHNQHVNIAKTTPSQAPRNPDMICVHILIRNTTQKYIVYNIFPSANPAARVSKDALPAHPNHHLEGPWHRCGMLPLKFALLQSHDVFLFIALTWILRRSVIIRGRLVLKVIQPDDQNQEIIKDHSMHCKRKSYCNILLSPVIWPVLFCLPCASSLSKC